MPFVQFSLPAPPVPASPALPALPEEPAVLESVGPPPLPPVLAPLEPPVLAPLEPPAPIPLEPPSLFACTTVVLLSELQATWNTRRTAPTLEVIARLDTIELQRPYH
jgi:hypothetical protein